LDFSLISVSCSKETVNIIDEVQIALIRIVTFENYVHGNALVEGEKEIMSMGQTEEGYYWHKIKGEIVLTREKDGEQLIIKRKVEKDRYLINGYKDADTPKEGRIEGKVRVKKSNDGLMTRRQKRSI
jgi:hypothetical protein